MQKKGKRSDPCISHNDCSACNSLTEEQRLQLSTPSYRLKKEKRELKQSTDTPKKDSDSSSLIHPSSVTLVGAVDGQGMEQSPGSSSGTKKKSNPSDKPKGHSAKHSKSGSEKPVKSPTPNPHRSSTDARIEELDQKWSDRFNRLEALLLAKTLDKPELTALCYCKVTPTTSPPVGITRSSEPFIRPSCNLQTTDVATLHRQATDKFLSSTFTKQPSSDLHGSS